MFKEVRISFVPPPWIDLWDDDEKFVYFWYPLFDNFDGGFFY